MLSFEWPWAWLLLGLPCLWHFFAAAKPIQNRGSVFLPFFAQIQSWQLQSSGQRSGFLHRYVFMAIWFLLIATIVQPVWLSQPESMWQKGRNIMLVLDISGSMRMQDRQMQGRTVRRMDVLQAAAKDFIEQRRGDRLGLVVFGSRPYMQTPLTFDRQTVAHFLLDTTVGLAGDLTAIGDALAVGIQQLLKVKEGSRVLVLFTDGSNNAGRILPIEAARFAQQHGIKVYTIGLAASPYLPPELQPNMQELQQIATMTRAVFFKARDHQDLRAVYRSLNKLEPVAQQSLHYRWRQDLYCWPLGMALLLSVIWAGYYISTKEH